MSKYIPSYISICKSGEISRRIEAAGEICTRCSLCPHRCGVDRSLCSDGYCRSSLQPVVASAGPHFGEEPPLVGLYGSGTIFFSGCNLECLYCQNYEISQLDTGKIIGYEELADIMIGLQQQGCHNINLVTPTHMVYPILKALKIAVERGLSIPLVYNSGGYEAVKTLKLLDGIIDIYMPDFKYFNEKTGYSLSHARYYPQIAQMAIEEMFRQVGGLKTDRQGIAYKGLIVRHLILPCYLDESKKIIDFVAALSKDIYLNLMDQYRPEYKAAENSNLTRKVTSEEYFEVLNYAKEKGLAMEV
ncbi:MAG: radical SAM protein [Bacteroidales bacterium]|nr:radical SAM protein [Bacteroidales bacterium]